MTGLAFLFSYRRPIPAVSKPATIAEDARCSILEAESAHMGDSMVPSHPIDEFKAGKYLP